MSETTRGLITRTRPLTETSLIVHWLTPDLGRVSTVAKGARRPKSAFRGKLDLFYEADFSFRRSRRSELHTLSEVGLREVHKALREDLDLLRQACYCAALIEQTTETETPLGWAYELMTGLLEHLPGRRAQPQTVLAFELRLLRELGLSPDARETRLTPGSTKLLASLTEPGWELVARLKPSEAQCAELFQFLHGFLIFHLGRIPKGRAAALHPLLAQDRTGISPDEIRAR